jgi:hypothetical protein
MSVTAAQILRVRSLANVTLAQYSDAAITAIIEEYEKMDTSGYFPDEDDYTATYDLYRAAADVAELEAAKVAMQYDTTVDGAKLDRSQIAEGLYTLAARLRARGAAKGCRSVQEDITDDDDDDDIGNE